MKIHFLGASGEVTGSCYLLETSSARVLVDFGLFQGSRQDDARNREDAGFDAARLDAVVLTHAHVDHVGRMPLLPGRGFRGKLWSTPATMDLARVMLEDSAEVQAFDAERQTRRRQRMGGAALEPLYTRAQGDQVLARFSPSGYGQTTTIAPGIDIRFVDAGHIIGSASVEVTVREGGSTKVVCFSGDVGVKGHPLMRDPTTFDHADLVVMESTYGDRDHRPLADTVRQFEEIIKKAVWEKQKVLIPAFAVGRTQVLMYHLCELGKGGRVPSFPVYIDSPMASEATEVHRRFRKDLDPAAQEILSYGERPDCVTRFAFTPKAEESRKLNDVQGCMVVIAASGMCTGGRIVHHLKHNLWRKGVQVVIAGYQGHGTLGRRLVEGAKVVRVLGEWLQVRADIHTLGGFSAHAGQGELIDWARPWARSRPRVCLTHGEDPARMALAGRLEKELGISPMMPGRGEVVEL